MEAALTPPGSALRKSLLGVLLALAAVAVLALLLEGGLRLELRLVDVHGAWPETRESRFRAELDRALTLYRRHPYLNTAPHEGARVVAFGKAVAFNSLGYRSPERPLAKPSGTVRILCAGGSTTFDLLAATDEVTWPWRLEGELRRRGLPVEVWNAGFPGWTSLESLIAFALRDVDLAPDLLVLYQGVNDLQPVSHRPFDRQYEHGHAELAARALGFELPPLSLWDRSLLGERLRALLGAAEDPWSRLGPAGSSSPRRRQMAEAGRAVFARNLRSAIALARARGTTIVLLTQTIRIRRDHAAEDRAWLARWYPELEPAAAPGELERLNEVTRALGREGGALILDVAARIHWDDADFADPLHFSAAGSEKLARFLAAQLPLRSRR